MPRIISIDVTASIDVAVPDCIDDASAYEEFKKRINTHLELNENPAGDLQIQDVSISKIGFTAIHN